MKLCCRLLQFFVEISSKNDKFGYLAPFWGSEGCRTTLVDGSLESPWSTLYSRYLNFFAIYYCSWAMRLDAYNSSVFAGCRPLCAHIWTWTGLSSSNHSCHQKTRDTRLPDCEYRIYLRSLVLTQYRSMTGGQTDRRTNGRAGGFAVAYTTLAKLLLRRAVKIAWKLFAWSCLQTDKQTQAITLPV